MFAIYTGTVWEYVAFLANALIFLMVGLRVENRSLVGHTGLVVLGGGGIAGVARHGRFLDLCPSFNAFPRGHPEE